MHEIFLTKSNIASKYSGKCKNHQTMRINTPKRENNATFLFLNCKNGKVLLPKMPQYCPENATTRIFLRDPKPRQLRPSLVQHRLFLLAAALQRRRAIGAQGGACPSRVCSTTRSRRANHDASHKIKYNKYSRFVFKYSKWHVVTRTRS